MGPALVSLYTKSVHVQEKGSTKGMKSLSLSNIFLMLFIN